MNTLLVYAIITGISWGIWPLLIMKSNMGGYASGLLITLTSVFIITPVALGSGQIQKIDISISLWCVIIAGIIAGVGLLTYNTMLSKARPNNIGTLIIVTTMIQILIPTIYQCVCSGDYSPKKIAGIIGACCAMYILTS